MQRFGRNILREYSAISSDTLKDRAQHATFGQRKVCLRPFHQRAPRHLAICRAHLLEFPFPRSSLQCSSSPASFFFKASVCSFCRPRSPPILASAGFAIDRMKFGKRLQRLLDDSLPEWRGHFISYKRLKQCLKLINLGDDENPLCFSHYCICGGSSRDTWPSAPLADTNPLKQFSSLFCRPLARSEAVFIALLFLELKKLNTFFLWKEEDFIIRVQETKGKFEKLLETCGGNLEPSQEIIEIQKAVVNIHGEMVLLENYSALNYTGLVKIIKKHDKRTGGALRMPFIQSVLQEPFFATKIISKLVHECEEMLQLLFPHSNLNFHRPLDTTEKQNSYDQQDSFPSYYEVSEVFIGDDNVEWICRNTMAACQILREFRKGSSTYNLFSVPPFGFAEYDEGPCCKSAITEQPCWYPEIPAGSKL